MENTYTLVLPVAHESHAGKYSVKASNEHGADESSVRLSFPFLSPFVSFFLNIKILPQLEKKKKIHQTFSEKASLTIVMKPELSYEQQVRVEYYEETNIEVKVTAHPKSKVKW